MPPIRPELLLELAAAGPTAVQDCCETGFVGSWVKRRKPAANWSALASPRPEPGTEFWRVSDQLTRVPFSADELLVMRSVQLPCEPWFLNVLRGSWGVNGPAPMPIPGWVT